jgi:hypothetical protein
MKTIKRLGFTRGDVSNIIKWNIKPTISQKDEVLLTILADVCSWKSTDVFPIDKDMYLWILNFYLDKEKEGFLIPKEAYVILEQKLGQFKSDDINNRFKL